MGWSQSVVLTPNTSLSPTVSYSLIALGGIANLSQESASWVSPQSGTTVFACLAYLARALASAGGAAKPRQDCGARFRHRVLWARQRHYHTGVGQVQAEMGRREPPQRLKPYSKQCLYRSGEPLRHPKAAVKAPVNCCVTHPGGVTPAQLDGLRSRSHQYRPARTRMQWRGRFHRGHRELISGGGELGFHVRIGHTFRESWPDEARRNESHAELIAAGSKLLAYCIQPILRLTSCA